MSTRALRKKKPLALWGDPDIAILPESTKRATLEKRNWQWIGSTPKSGLGIATREGEATSLIRRVCEDEKWIGLMETRNPSPLTVVAVWACYSRSPRKTEMGPVLKGIEEILSAVEGKDAIIAGDFNNGAFWDKPGRADNFSELAKCFEDAGFVSAYHSFFNEELGQETRGTFYLRREQRNSYHIDYCFIPKKWISSIRSIEVGGYRDWIEFSDHMPITLDIGTEG